MNSTLLFMQKCGFPAHPNFIANVESAVIVGVAGRGQRVVRRTQEGGHFRYLQQTVWRRPRAIAGIQCCQQSFVADRLTIEILGCVEPFKAGLPGQCPEFSNGHDAIIVCVKHRPLFVKCGIKINHRGGRR